MVRFASRNKDLFLLGVGLAGPQSVLHDNQTREAEAVTKQNTRADLRLTSPDA